jgi:peptidoglycan glycosyltransferase
MQAPLGRIVGEAFNKFETAYLAIGLVHESMNALHVAIVASTVANRGMYATPRLLRQRRSILGDVVMAGPASSPTRIASPEAAAKIVGAMKAVVTHPHGSGRRVVVEGLSVAMKTGTAGERKSGLEAVVLAFAPADSPKIAFGVIAEDAGPAEFAGAAIAKKFLTEIKPRL